MAYQHHDPRYAQSPYNFQAPFAPPQQHNPAFGFGHPVAPTPLAPPQAYLPNRPQPSFPPHPTVVNQPGFPGPFANAGQYQHNAQYNPNMVAAPGPMGYPNPQQMAGQFYNQQPFQNRPPMPQHAVPGMAALSPINAVPPPPPPGVQQQHQQHQQHQHQQPSAPVQFPPNLNLPPKPPSVGYRESVEIHSRQDSNQLQTQGLPGLGTTPSGTGNGDNQHKQMSYQSYNQQSYVGGTDGSNDQHDRNASQHKQFNRYPASNAHSHTHPPDPNQAPYSPASLTVADLSHTAKAAPNGDASRDESLDMYSPQLHPQDLPGIGDASGLTTVPSTTQAKSADMAYSPPVELPSSITADSTTKKVQASNAPTLDPFAVKERASQALRDLYSNNIQFLDIAGNGIHPNVLRNLCLELGLELEVQKPKQKTPSKPVEVTEPGKTEAQVAPPPVQAPTPTPPKKQIPQAPSKPLSREEYLAKLKAAKGDKASSPGASSEQSPVPPAKIPEASTAIPEPVQPPTSSNGTASPKTPASKKTDLKSKEQNALLRQRLEALKKSTAEKQRKEAEQAAAQAAASALQPLEVKKANTASNSKSETNGQYTPANPFFSATGSFSGLPGLSMLGEEQMHQDNTPRSEEYGFPNDEEEEEPGEIAEDEFAEGEYTPEESEVVTLDIGRKRSYQPAFGSSYDQTQNKRRAESPKPSHVVIELSDDEEGEVTTATTRPQAQRQWSGSAKDPAPMPHLQSHIDTLAAQEAKIRMFKQQIAAKEAERKARKATSSKETPTPSGTPSQTQSLTQMPETALPVQASSTLAAAGEKVQAQQETLEAQKSAIVERLQKEEAGANAGDSTPRNLQRQQRTQTLRASIEKLELDIARAETEKLRIQQEIERGIQGREEFSKELKQLLAEMEAEDALAAKSHAEQDEVMESPGLPSMNHEQSGEEEEDDTMDISEDEEVEISDDELSVSHAGFGANEIKGSTEAIEQLDESPAQAESESESESESEQDESQEDSNSAKEERGYSPRLDETAAIPDVEADEGAMDYEPDYDPELDPEINETRIPSNESEAGDYEPDEDLVEESPAEKVISIAESPNDPTIATATGNSPDVVSLESPEEPTGTADDGYEEGKMIEDDDDDEQGDEEEEEDEDEDDDDDDKADHGAYSPTEPQISGQIEPDNELATEDQPPDVDNEPEDMVVDEESDSDESEHETPQTSGYVPYQSPLATFNSYRFHPQYVTQVPGGLQSLTHSHCINPDKRVCRSELQGGCSRSDCPDQHFRDMKLKDEDLIRELGSLNEGTNEEERNRYTTGLKTLVTQLRDKNLHANVNEVGKELVAYRMSFWNDPTRVITRIGSGL